MGQGTLPPRQDQDRGTPPLPLPPPVPPQTDATARIRCGYTVCLLRSRRRAFWLQMAFDMKYLCKHVALTLRGPSPYDHSRLGGGGTGQQFMVQGVRGTGQQFMVWGVRVNRLWGRGLWVNCSWAGCQVQGRPIPLPQ